MRMIANTIWKGIVYILKVPWVLVKPGPARNKRKKSLRQRLIYRLLWTFRILLIALAIDALYLHHIWPNWSKLQHGIIPKSAFIKNYQVARKSNPQLPPLRWNPVSIRKISKHMRLAVIVSEDSRFFNHKGIDVRALADAIEYNFNNMEFKYGASTITQQTVKNLFLNPSKNPLRKWHELILTMGMENNLRKSRILNLYLNIAEFGKGIYGVEAAARHYWHISATELSAVHASELAATLPSPQKHNPRTRTKAFIERVKKIRQFMRQSSLRTLGAKPWRTKPMSY